MTARLTEGPRPRLATAAGALALLTVLVADLSLGNEYIIVASLMIGPVVAVLGAPPRNVLALGIVAVALAMLSGFWNDNLFDADWVIRALVVALGSMTAWFASRSRARELRQVDRMAVLGELADVSAGSLSVQQTAERIAGVLVPAVAAAIAIDGRRGETTERLAA